MKSKSNALNRASAIQKKDYDKKEDSKEWRGGKPKKASDLGEGVKCANCGSLKHDTGDCPFKK